MNVQGHLAYLEDLLRALDLRIVLDALGHRLVTFPDLGLDRHMEDRPLWEFCQAEGWVLFTEDRNDEDNTSLQATLDSSWRQGHLPVLTLSNKGRFARNRNYAGAVANDVADILFGIETEGAFRDQPRIYVPLRWP